MLLTYFYLQSRCFPIQNLPASSLDALARRSYFSSTLTHAPGSLCRLRLLSVLYFSRTCVLCSDLCWVALSWPVIRYSATNSIVFAQYTLSFFDLPITDLSQTVLAVGVATFSVAGRSFKTTVPTRSSFDFSCCHLHQMGTQSCERAEFIQGPIPSIVGFFMSLSDPGSITIRSVAFTGVAVLAGFTRISEPFTNFHNIWQGGTSNPNALATALVKTNFTYVGWSNAFNVLGEVNGTSSVRTVRNAGLISLGIVTMLFFAVNLAYIAAVPLDEIRHSRQLVGALFFEHVFSGHWASKILPILVALSCVGNIVSGISRVSLIYSRLPRRIHRLRLWVSISYVSPFAMSDVMHRRLAKRVFSVKSLVKASFPTLHFSHLLGPSGHLLDQLRSNTRSPSSPYLRFPHETRLTFFLTSRHIRTW